MKEIRVIISEDGNISIDHKGFTGKECVKDTQEMVDKLGEIVSEEKKPEYDRKALIRKEQVIRR